MIATVEAVSPGAKVLSAPAGWPVDAIAAAISPAEVTPSPAPSPSQAVPRMVTMGPPGAMMAAE